MKLQPYQQIQNIGKTSSTRVLVSEATEEQLKTYNYRTPFKDEFIADCESREEAEKAQKLMADDNLGFTAYRTGGRGFHLQAYFSELLSLDQHQREFIRKELTKRYGLDVNDWRGEKRVIGREDMLHRNGKAKKVQIGEVKKDSKIPAEILNQAKSIKEPEPIEASKLPSISCGIINYALHNKLKVGVQKNNILFKNTAIKARSLGKEKGRLLCEQIAKAQDHNPAEILGWFEKTDVTSFNHKELEKWVSDYDIEELKNKCNECRNKDKALISADDLTALDIPEQQWLIDKFILNNGISIIGGDFGDFKSFLALHLAVASSLGEAILGNYSTPKPLKVLFVDEENGKARLKRRLNQLIKGHEIKNKLENLSFAIFHSIKLDVTDHRRELLEKHIKEFKPNLVVIDSMVRFMIGQENSSDDVRKIFETLKHLKEAYNTGFIIIHHLRKGGADKHSLRGSGDFIGFADIILLIKRLESGKDDFTITWAKMRDEAEPQTIKFKALDTADGGLQVAYDGAKQKTANAVDRCEKDLMAWLVEEDIRELHTKDAIGKMKAKAHTESAVYSALKSLVTRQVIIKQKYGKYKVGDEVVIL